MAMAVTTKATRKALALRLGILGDEEIVRMSVTEGGITQEQLIDKQRRPVMLGVHDPRMGTTDRDAKCGTCGCDAIECPGHFGHIALAQPVYHPGYITNVLKVLRCICSHCGRLRLNERER
jgi:DNA-directed RNA polymerase II subunit RPB1